MIEKYLKKTDFSSHKDFIENYDIIVPNNFNFAYNIVDEWAKTDPDKRALCWTNDFGDNINLTFAQLKDLSDKTASFLLSLNIKKGDMVMLILKRSIEFWQTIIALHKIGAVAIPATHLLTEQDIVYRNNAAGEKAINDIKKHGVEGLFLCGDIAKKDTLETFANKVIDSYGKIDYLINNACITRKGIISGCEYDDFNYTLKVGVTAPYMLSKLFLNHFNTGGVIINISSTRAFMSQPDTESYTAAKGGILALTHALAISLAGKVRVNSISPGWIDVSKDNEDIYSISDHVQHPVRRIGNPMDIARTALFLCDERNRFITGQNITVDGGMTKQMIYHGDYGWKFNE